MELLVTLITDSHFVAPSMGWYQGSKQVKPSQAKPSQVKSSQIKSNQVKSSQVKSSQPIVRIGTVQEYYFVALSRTIALWRTGECRSSTIWYGVVRNFCSRMVWQVIVRTRAGTALYSTSWNKKCACDMIPPGRDRFVARYNDVLVAYFFLHHGERGTRQLRFGWRACFAHMGNCNTSSWSGHIVAQKTCSSSWANTSAQ